MQFAKKSILVLVAGLAVVGFGTRLKGNTFTDDARYKVNSARFPGRTIGKLFTDSGSCTGTLVGRDLVITAAHCVIDDNTKKLQSGTFVFYPGYDHGGEISSTVSYVWWGTNDPSIYRGADWALLRLRKPLGDSVGWMGVRGPDLRDHLHEGFNAAGYSSDFLNGRAASGERNCVFTKFNPSHHFYLHNCDNSRGASGGPIFDSEHYIVALQVAEYRDGEESRLNVPYSDQTANIAVPATAFLQTLNRIRNGDTQ